MIVSKQLLGRLPPGQRRPCVHPLATVDRSSVSSTSRQLLDSFWESRGVLDPVHRKRLVDAAEALDTGAYGLQSSPRRAQALTLPRRIIGDVSVHLYILPCDKATTNSLLMADLFVPASLGHTAQRPSLPFQCYQINRAPTPLPPCLS